MIWKTQICSAIAAWLVAAPGLLGSPAEDFKTGNLLYDAGNFSEAIAAYEKIQPKTAHVYFNLGNAYFRAGQLGKAVLNYERARLLSPRDPDILANLRFAEQRLDVQEANTPAQPMARLLRTATLSRTLNEWAAYEVAGLWLTAIGIAVWIWFPKGRGLTLTVSAVAFLWFAATASLLAYRAVGQRTSPTAVVLEKNIEARFAPLADATVHFKLTEGTEVAIKEDRGQWLFVQRADGQQGWVRSEALERID
jgi:tetratricopeptide (TPR) repeat protein